MYVAMGKDGFSIKESLDLIGKTFSDKSFAKRAKSDAKVRLYFDSATNRFALKEITTNCCPLILNPFKATHPKQVTMAIKKRITQDSVLTEVRSGELDEKMLKKAATGLSNFRNHLTSKRDQKCLDDSISALTQNILFYPEQSPLVT